MELEFLAWLNQRIPPQAGLQLGIGDDAAVIALGSSATVVTTDTITDGVDFILSQVDPRRIGRKALAVNLSDLAAMAARPVAAVISLVLPRAAGLALPQAIYEGLIPLAEHYSVAIAGGDFNAWDGPLAISVTLLGEIGPGGLLTRSGARPDDVLLVTGQLGGSILGRHFDFTPRVDEALLLAERYQLSAGMDLSDGLSLDLARLVAASGCGAELHLSQIPIAPAAEELAREREDGVTPLQHALNDGEDFELLLAAPAAVAEQMLREQPLNVPLTAIGRCTATPGVIGIDPSGMKRPLPAAGYVH